MLNQASDDKTKNGCLELALIKEENRSPREHSLWSSQWECDYGQGRMKSETEEREKIMKNELKTESRQWWVEESETR